MENKTLFNTPIKSDIKEQALILWEYLQIKETPKPVDCMIVLGSNDLRVADYAGELMLKGMAKHVVFSGAFGRNTQGVFTTTEAELFHDIASKKGVNPDHMFIENKATNTGQNMTYSLELLKQKGINPQSFMLIQKNFMGRRAIATFRVYEPTKPVTLCCPDIGFDDYPTADIDIHLMINTMVADFERVLRYPELGYQIKQPISEMVYRAYVFLTENGYDQQV
ncbi:YdcF family protein [Vibrio sp.]|nr:YdcF family protein [Vibrio sp.]